LLSRTLFVNESYTDISLINTIFLVHITS